MIVTRDFVYLHLHKSGGTFVNEFLLRFDPTARMLGYHLPYRELPVPHRQLPVLGTVRNPASYYVSWYAFQSAMARPNALFQIMSDNRRLDFSGTIENLLTLSDRPDLIDRVAAQMPPVFTNSGLNLTRDCVRSMAGKEAGFYSFLFDRLFDGAAEARIAKMETLRQDLISLMQECGRALTAAEKSYIRNSPKTNTSAHRDYRSYYDDRLLQLVACRDSSVVDRFQYEL